MLTLLGLILAGKERKGADGAIPRLALRLVCPCRLQGPAAMTVHASWREDAACGDADPDLFFPLGTTGAALRQIEQAKRICHSCAAQIECLAWALDNGVAYGVWGGTTPEERAGHPEPFQKENDEPMSSVSRWRDSDHLVRAVATARRQEAFDAAVAAMLDDARGWRLAEMRKRRGMTQEQVAIRMGVSVPRVSQIERGEVATQDVLNRYVSALGGTLKLIADFGDEQLKIA